MGFVQLKARFRHTIKPIFWFFVAVFLVGGIFSFSTYQHSRESGSTGPKRKVARVVASVNGQRIPRDELDQFLFRVSHEASGAPVEARHQILSQWLDAQVDQIVMTQAEKREKIQVSTKEAEAKRTEAVDRALAPQIEQRTALAQRLQREGMTLEQYKQKIATERFGNLDAFEAQVAEEKLRNKVQSQVQVTDQQLKESYTETRARHILIDPKDLHRKAEAKLDEERDKLKSDQEAAQKAGKTADPAVQKRLDAIEVERQGLKTRNWDQEAQKKAEDLHKQILAGADFATLAKENSSDPGSAAQGGDLGFFRRGMMVAEFDQSAFSLQPGQVSAPIKSKFGYHIIKVEERKSTLPADFEKNKATYREQYIQEQKDQVWREYVSKLKDSAKIEVLDPELQAYRLLDQGGDADKAIPLLEQSMAQDPENAGAIFELAQLRHQKGNDQEALKLLQVAEKVPGADRSAELMYSLGDLLEKQKQTAQALPYYKKASDLTAPVDQPQNQGMHLRLQIAYIRLGQKDLAKQESDWLERFTKAQAEQGGGPGMMNGGAFTVR